MLHRFRSNSRGRVYYHLDRLGVGDHTVIPKFHAHSAACAAYAYGRRASRIFSCETLKSGSVRIIRLN